ncbi:hypothetical protein A6A08_02655 [Nocardiopsis sp. TSRI0078]|uniref:tripartite tricarboxylate transporter TctB family protein n=1 Tax=unclassified Nocardiopsis TaxID=2649073 RepID=UPI00093D5672|nr:tripartite tricarboxylate transporter TctB family protein [Nocardiopsis sp. TSRI0078]OKI23686.1 hypothetical protein A6A08_02655 [Nocardiopsis sp. TSRI0078]
MSDPRTGPGAPPAEEAARPGSRTRELVPAAAGAVLGLGAFALALQIPEGARLTQFSPRWWPEVLSLALVGLGLAHGAVSLLRPRGAEEEAPEPSTRSGALRLLSMLAAVAGYGVLWYFVDFRVSTAILVAALAFLGGGRGWKALIAFPVVVTAVLYLLFGVLLRVPL